MSYIFRKIFLLTFTWLCLSMVTFLFPAKVFAQEVYFQDDFQAGNLDKWQPTVDTGSLWKIQDGKVRVKVDRGSRRTELIPKDELWLATSPDMKISLDMKFIRGIDRNVIFRWTGRDSWYQLHLKDTFFNLVRVLMGRAHGLNEFVEYEFKNGQAYHLDLYLQNDQILIYIDGQFVTAQTDSYFDGTIGKVGLKVHTGSIYPTEVEFDNVLVTQWQAPPDHQLLKLDMDLQMQTDDLWAETIYDTAQEWSGNEQPTIGRWGCALTSMAMVLDYYSISHFSDATPITPETLNSWLLEQPDGYVGEGLVNWLAITRLTKQLSDLNQTPALEFAYQPENMQNIIQQNLDLEQPLIANVPDHFVVIDGYHFTPDQKRFSILDPFYQKKWLDEHTKLLSLRTFIPSFTDLSYLMLVVPKEVSLSDTDNWQIMNEKIEADPHGQESVGTNEFQIGLVPKPTSAKYSILYNTTQPATIEVLVYDKNGQVTTELIRLVGSGQLDFFQADNYQAQVQISSISIQDTIQELSLEHHIQRKSVAKHLDRIGKYWATEQDINSKQKYQTLLSRLITQYQPYLSIEGQKRLKELFGLNPDT